MARPILASLLVVGIVTIVDFGCALREQSNPAGGAVLFSPTQSGALIVIPRDALPAEQRAAELCRSTLAKAANLPASAFPIQSEREPWPGRAIFLGATARSENFLVSTRVAPFDTAVGVRVRAGNVIVRSERRESCEVAVAWFLERYLCAHWFMPGPLGEQIPPRAELVLAAGEEKVEPGFVSRELGGLTGTEGTEWQIRNRLEARLDHAHSLAQIFRPEDFQRTPEMASLRHGQRYLPTEAGDTNWQPDLGSAAAVRHATTAAMTAFAADPRRISFSLGTNDSIRFDDSAATSAVTGPLRFFRHRPDYSDLVFGFTNAVATSVGVAYPGKWISTYAYNWSENTPRFSVARNVVPFLTADRSEWFDPGFAAEDRALIERWCHSGAGLVGVYDYLYGAPFLVPRPTLYALKASIPFEYQAGVRAFYGEANPNWALDGPKLWLAAQLLWSPQQNPSDVLETYYREFWGECAAPMREYFSLCDRAWSEQKRPTWWLRYFNDEDQARLFSAESRAALRAQLTKAIARAQRPATRERIEFVSAGLGVTEAFAEFCTARDHLSRMVDLPAAPDDLVAAWRDYQVAKANFVERHARVMREYPLALSPVDLRYYLRNQSDGRVARALNRSARGRQLLGDSRDLLDREIRATPQDVARVLSDGTECLQDSTWSAVTVPPVEGSVTFEWTDAVNAWHGAGEPWETRRLQLKTGDDGERALRMSGCRTESLGQWVSATPGSLYAAQVNVSSQTSPGTATFLIMSFLDDKGRHIDLGQIDRLPADEVIQHTGLCVIARAPDSARFVGFAVRVLNQFPGDFAEFSRASLRQVTP